MLKVGIIVWFQALLRLGVSCWRARAVTPKPTRLLCTDSQTPYFARSIFPDNVTMCVHAYRWSVPCYSATVWAAQGLKLKPCCDTTIEQPLSIGYCVPRFGVTLAAELDFLMKLSYLPLKSESAIFIRLFVIRGPVLLYMVTYFRTMRVSARVACTCRDYVFAAFTPIVAVVDVGSQRLVQGFGRRELRSGSVFQSLVCVSSCSATPLLQKLFYY